MSSNGALSNNSLCPVCGGDHNVLVIPLENGGCPFLKEKATKVNITNAKRRATRLDLVDVFWSSNADGV